MEFRLTTNNVLMDRKITHWPNNERVAVLVTIMFEVWSEGKAPPYSPMTTSLKPGTPDLLGISWSEYGGKTGIWRFMRILAQHEIRATICMSARVAELGFQWHGDHNDSDLPYAFDSGKGILVAIPHSDFTDNRVLRGSPRDFF